MSGAPWERTEPGVFRRPRTARKRYPCGTCDTATIAVGERHWQWSAAPNTDSNNTDRWARMRECAACADRYGRPVPPPAPKD